jgi:uridine kinase
MAIRVLLDHGVPQDHITFVTFLVAKQGGIVMLRKAFPQVTIVCSAVDNDLLERWLECIDVEGEGLRDPKLPVVPAAKEGRKVWVVEPGMGHIGQCHFVIPSCEKLMSIIRR